VVEQSQTSTTGDSDYQAVGGGPAIASVVDHFYREVLADPQLTGYFAGTDLVRLKRHQVQLVSQVMGGPVEYDGPALADAHKGRGITGADFGKVVEHLIAALRKHDVPEDIIGRVVTALGATQDDIVGAH
jgi:hemoglobin